MTPLLLAIALPVAALFALVMVGLYIVGRDGPAVREFKRHRRGA